MFNFIKRLFLKKETRTLTQFDSNAALAARLFNDIQKGTLKNYKNIDAFISKYMVTNAESPLERITTTKEIEDLKRRWTMLKFKCNDKELDKFMKS